MKCPCCQQAVDPAQQRGIAINRSAYLRSQIISLTHAYERALMTKVKGESLEQMRERIFSIRRRLVDHEVELEQLKEFL